MRLKKIISNLLLAIWLPIMCLSLCGFTANGEVKIKHSGKGTATFFVESELDGEAFQEKVESVVKDFNTVSGSNDMVKLKDVAKENGLYEVSVSFRRIDKVHPRGNVYLYEAEMLKAKQSEELDRLTRWERGDVNCKFDIFYNQLRGSVELKKPRENGPSVVIKPSAVAGQEISVEDFKKNVSAKNTVLTYQLLDTLGVQKIRVSLPGKITYYGGSITVLDEDTFEMTPTTVQAQVTRNDPDTLESIITTEDIQIFVGYVAFQKSISPLTITVIVIASLTVVGLVVCALVYFYQRGKRVQEKENLKKELENGRESSY